MTEGTTVGSRCAALVMVVSGLLTVVLSLTFWTSCPTTPCGGNLMAISTYSGVDLGFGDVTAFAGVAVAAIGLGALRHDGQSRFATSAVLLSLLIVMTVAASVTWMYVIPGDDKEYSWPPSTAVLVGVVGLIAVESSLRLRRAMLPRPSA